MSRATDLMGSGMPAELARRVGLHSAALAAAGNSSQANAAAIPTEQTFTIGTVAGATTNGWRLSATAELLREYTVVNTSGTNGIVYPPTSGTINGLSANTGVTVAANKVGRFRRYSSTGWSGLVGA